MRLHADSTDLNRGRQGTGSLDGVLHLQLRLVSLPETGFLGSPTGGRFHFVKRIFNSSQGKFMLLQKQTKAAHLSC